MANVVFTMSFFQMFVLWVLMAAISCLKSKQRSPLGDLSYGIVLVALFSYNFKRLDSPVSVDRRTKGESETGS
ncbi:hypothetical protein HanPI659440_Chr11g0418061 [Helianthus annuus]|nr:hypothetical protein HanPI659440_Chr11g0418061 [Helianthus annuus]